MDQRRDEGEQRAAAKFTAQRAQNCISRHTHY